MNKLFNSTGHYYLLILVAFLFACKGEAIPPDETEEGNVFILNEGAFQASNASVDRFNPVTATLSSSVFSTQNQRELGDVLQSLYIDQDQERGYFVVNNSQKIEVVNMEDMTSLATISGFTSPRYFLKVGENKAYVSDLFGGSVSIVDMENNSVSGNIPLAGWTEEMIVVGGRVFVANVSSEYIYVINPQTDKLEDSVRVGIGSSSLGLDYKNRLWVLCGGDYFTDTPGTLVSVNPDNLTVIESFPFESGNYPSRMIVNQAGTQLYWLNNGVFRMSVNGAELPASPILRAAAGSYYYGIGIDPGSSELYVADAVDFSQQGAVLRFEENLTPIDTIRVGVAPNGFVFN